MANLLQGIFNIIQGIFQSIFAVFQSFFNLIYSIIHGLFVMVWDILESIASFVGASANFVLSNIIVLGVIAAVVIIYIDRQKRINGSGAGSSRRKKVAYGLNGAKFGDKI